MEERSMTDMLNSATVSARAFVSVSIDIDGPDSIGNELIARCDRRKLPITWAARNLASTSLLRAVSSSQVSHEVALLTDSALIKGETTRSELLAQVAQPLQLAAARDVNISTLAIAEACQPQHIDLLTKYGVTVIRTPHVFSSHTTTGIRAICYGLWQVPVSATLHGGGWVANLSQWRFARKTIERAILRGGWCHLRIDVARLAAGDTACGLRTVDRLLGHLQQLQSAGHIQVETLRDTAARLAPKRSAAAAQSILRAA
jgi:hypothetical protein